MIPARRGVRDLLPLRWCMGVLAFVVPSASRGQTPPSPAPFAPVAIALTDMSGFRPARGAWEIAGAVATSRESTELATERGTGFLVWKGADSAPLLTTWEHQDISLAFDVLLSSGATGSVCLAGRYCVQLADSWRRGAPTVQDMGGIPGGGGNALAGVPPRQNSSRAAGLWQHVEIIFRAPRFDRGSSEKIANARFERVSINGVVAQEMVEVGHTDGAPVSREAPAGPLAFRGHKGHFALRNISYRAFAGPASLSRLHYRAYEGDPIDSAFATARVPVREGDATAISIDHITAPDKVAMSYTGTLTVPVAGNYQLQLTLPWIPTDSAPRGPSVGGGRIVIDDARVLTHVGAERRVTAMVTLTAGSHAFALDFYKNRAASNRRDVTLWLEGASVERQALHDESGSPGFGPPGFGSPINPIIVDASREPVVLRSFLRHGTEKRALAVSVADPVGAHYSYDLARGALLYAWRGPFLETTQMWHERGEDQLAVPLGSTLTLPGTVALAFLADQSAVWPDSIADTEFRRDGYALDPSGRPTFLYRVRGVSVEDAIRPDASGLSLVRDVRLRAASTDAGAGLYIQVAAADRITRERDGSYAVGDRSFYVSVNGPQPTLRRSNGRDELIIPVRFDRGEARVTYSLIW